MLVTMKDVLRDAEKREIAVGAFNAPNLATLHAILAAAESLSELRNEAKLKAIENGNLKMENRELKNQIDMLRRNVRELTEHCKDADSQIMKQQATLALLRRQLEEEESRKGGQ